MGGAARLPVASKSKAAKTDEEHGPGRRFRDSAGRASGRSAGGRKVRVVIRELGDHRVDRGVKLSWRKLAIAQKERHSVRVTRIPASIGQKRMAAIGAIKVLRSDWRRLEG